MATRLQLRRGTAAEWTTTDPVLSSGEPGFETDTNKMKFGDGSTAWSSLDYFAADAPAGGSTGSSGGGTGDTGGGGVPAAWLQATATSSTWVALGEGAADATTTSNRFVAMGYDAATSQITGTDWVALGHRVAVNQEAGSRWVALGAEAGFDNVSGNDWVAIGSAAGRRCVQQGWTAIGRESAANNQSGADWVAIGKSANMMGTTSRFYVSVGNGSAWGNTGGEKWVAIGFNAGSNMGNADNCTYVGTYTGADYTDQNNVLCLSTGDTPRIVFDGQNYLLPSLPTSAPSTSGALWNDGGTLKVAA